jgi:hypothetical protein
MRSTLVALLLVGALLASGCVQNIAEGQIKKTLTKMLGPADKYVVDIRNTSDGELLSGKVNDLDITGRRVRTKDGLCLDRFHVRMKGLKLDKDKKNVESVQEAVFDIDILQEDLSKMARAKVQNFGDVQVLLGAGDVSVVAPAKALNLAVDLSVQGSLQVQDGTRINFAPRAVALGPLTLADGPVQALAARINPIADLTGLPIPIFVDVLTSQAGRLAIQGRLFLDKTLPAAEPPVPAPSPEPSAPAPQP